MARHADNLFEDETIAAGEAEVDAVILGASGARKAFRAMLVERGEMAAALADAKRAPSLAFARVRQPERPDR